MLCCQDGMRVSCPCTAAWPACRHKHSCPPVWQQQAGHAWQCEASPCWLGLSPHLKVTESVSGSQRSALHAAVPPDMGCMGLAASRMQLRPRGDDTTTTAARR